VDFVKPHPYPLKTTPCPVHPKTYILTLTPHPQPVETRLNPKPHTPHPTPLELHVTDTGALVQHCLQTDLVATSRLKVGESQAWNLNHFSAGRFEFTPLAS